MRSWFEIFLNPAGGTQDEARPDSRVRPMPGLSLPHLARASCYFLQQINVLLGKKFLQAINKSMCFLASWLNAEKHIDVLLFIEYWTSTMCVVNVLRVVDELRGRCGGFSFDTTWILGEKIIKGITRTRQSSTHVARACSCNSPAYSHVLKPRICAPKTGMCVYWPTSLQAWVYCRCMHSICKNMPKKIQLYAKYHLNICKKTIAITWTSTCKIYWIYAKKNEQICKNMYKICRIYMRLRLCNGISCIYVLRHCTTHFADVGFPGEILSRWVVMYFSPIQVKPWSESKMLVFS